MTLTDLAKYSMSRSVARSLCDCWASCLRHRPSSCYCCYGNHAAGS